MLVAIAGGGYSTLQVCVAMQWGSHASLCMFVFVQFVFLVLFPLDYGVIHTKYMPDE